MLNHSVLAVDWPAPDSVRAFYTTRVGGTGDAPFDSFNLATHVDDSATVVADNRCLLRRQLKLAVEPMWLNQTHSTEVFAVENAVGDTPDADASITSLSNQPLVVLTADCLPLLLCSRDGQQVAAVHAGWRGLANGIIGRTVTKFSADPASLIAWMGPAIGPQAFEVGSEVREQFCVQHSAFEDGFTAGADGKFLADIFALARTALGLLGVSAIYGGDVCTVQNPQQFFSYRRDGGVTGRQAALIWRTQ